MSNSFDLIVIGAGSGGLAAAKRAARHGASVAIVEGSRVGGTCVIRGCVPKKLLVYGSLYKEYIENASAFGVSFKGARIDSSQLLENVRKEVDRLNLLHIKFLEELGIKIFFGWASFIDSSSVLVRPSSDNQESLLIQSQNIIIAVGGLPNRPSIKGGDLAWVSDDMFLQTSFPKKVLVVGAGFIACEFSCILNAMGVEVIQFVRGQKLLKDFDHDLSGTLEFVMKSKGIKLCFGEYPQLIEGKIGNLNIKTNLSKQYNCGGILYAIGRKPRLEGLDLSAAGIEYSEGRIPVDNHNQTNISNIYAVGDVTNRINLTPVAIDEGRALSDRIFGNKQHFVNYNLVAKAVFSQPEIASVGLTEKQSIEQYGQTNIEVYLTRFRPMSQSMTKNKIPCLLKLIVDKSTDKIIGCHMFGEHASEIIQMAAISLGMGATKKDFDNTMALHPTISEEFVTMT